VIEELYPINGRRLSEIAVGSNLFTIDMADETPYHHRRQTKKQLQPVRC